MSVLTRVLRGVGACTALVGAYFLVPLDTSADGALWRGIFTVILIVLLIALVLWQLWFVEEERGDGRIDGLVMAVVALVVGFALTFYVVQVHDPTQFSGMVTRLDSLYFTTTTLTTTGFGDVSAQGQTARGLVLAMMIVNVVILAAAASLLTSRMRDRIARRSTRAGGPGT